MKLSLLLVVLVFAALMLWFGAMMIGESGRYDSFQRQCAAQGGHIYKPDSIAYCLTNDHRFIEVYP